MPFLGAIGEWLGEQWQRLQDRLPVPDDPIADLPADATNDVLTGTIAEMQRAIAEGGATGWALKTVAFFLNIAGIFSAVVEAALGQFRQVQAERYRPALLDVGTLIEGQRRGAVSLEVATTLLEKHGFPDTQVALLVTLSRYIKSIPDIVALYRRGELNVTEGRDQLKRLGISEGVADQLLLLGQTLLSVGDIRELTLRGLIGPDAYVDRLRNLGLPADEAHELRETWNFIPPPQDTIRMAVREVFSPEQRAALTLDQDFPEAFATIAAKLGISRETALDYWAAHWDLPSPTQVYTMLHRGLIDQGQVDDYLRAADFAPVWRPLMSAISYRTIPRVDARRMHAVGTLDDDQLVGVYMNMGFNEELALQMADFTIKWNSRSDDSPKTKTRDLTLGLITRAFRDGVIELPDYTEALQRLGFDEQETGLLTAIEDYEQSAKLSKLVERPIHTAYVRGYHTEDETRELLVLAEYRTGRIDALLLAWSLERANRELSQSEQAERDLTVGDVLTAYVDDSIGEQSAFDRLVAMGYDPPEASLKLANATSRKVRQAQGAVTTAVRLQYLQGAMTRAEASAELDSVLVPDRKRDALIDRWDMQRFGERRVLSVPQIEDAVKKTIISLDDAMERLEHQHLFLPEDATILARTWGAQMEDRNVVGGTNGRATA